jgi:hypothetical protein
MPTSLTDLISRVRAEIGDPPQPFRTTALGDGRTQWYDLPKQQIQAITEAAVVNGAYFTTLTDCSDALAWSGTTAYATGALVTYNGSYFRCASGTTGQPTSNGTYWTNISSSAYVINDTLGQMQLGAPVANNATLIIAGQSWSLFSDAELTHYISDALNQHCFNRTIKERLRDVRGFIDYRETPITVSNLPAIEIPLVVMLATINTFWTLANDTASDFNISTAEGTNIDRTSQYNQIMSQISGLTERYQQLCGQLNVGIYRMETLELRRTSYTTGRLVPGYKSREYDDHKWPQREIHPIDGRDADPSGIPDTIWSGQGY